MATLFKLFSCLPSDPEKDFPIITEEPKHHVFIIDREFFHFREELELILKPLKFCFLLALHVSKHCNAKNPLPTITILIFRGNEEELLTGLSTTTLSSSTIPEILETLKRLMNSDIKCIGHSSHWDISWDRLATSLAPYLLFQADGTCQVTFFLKSWNLDLYSIPMLERVDRWISVKIDSGNQLDDGDIFATNLVRNHQCDNFSVVMEIQVPTLASEMDLFFKRYVFQSQLGASPIQVEICLPMAIFGTTSLTIACQALPRFIQPTLFPELHFCESSLLNCNANVIHQNKCSSFKTRLEAVSLVKISGICETHLFGNQTFILTPCSTEDADESNNEQRFRALSYHLEEDELGLIVKSRAREFNNFSISPHFVLMTAPTGQLVLKSIATSDILLPLPSPGVPSTIDEREMLDMKTSFDKLQLVEHFDPFDFNSGLVGHLENQTNKTKLAPTTRVAKKSKYQPLEFI